MSELKFYHKLKKLIEENNIKNESLIIGKREIIYKELTFWCEEIWVSNNYCIAQNRTPEQCIQILKGLIL